MSTADFWSMGGYAFFVWGSYGTVAIVIAVETWLLKIRRRRAIAEIVRDKGVTGAR
jgi:heme exporter protein D